jgi:hypothetical protein
MPAWTTRLPPSRGPGQVDQRLDRGSSASGATSSPRTGSFALAGCFRPLSPPTLPFRSHGAQRHGLGEQHGPGGSESRWSARRSAATRTNDLDAEGGRARGEGRSLRAEEPAFVPLVRRDALNLRPGAARDPLRLRFPFPIGESLGAEPSRFHFAATLAEHGRLGLSARSGCLLAHRVH